MQLLILLVSREGELVTRNEIAKELWSSEVFVDTEHGINTAIRKIRNILRDDPESPSFIQTVPAMGYRFIAPLHTLSTQAANGTKLSHDPITENSDFPDSAPAAVPAPVHGTPSPQSTNKTKWLFVAPWGGSAVPLLALAIWYLRRPLPPPRITDYTKITRDGHEKLLGGTGGSRIYFTQFQPNSLNQVGVAGGEIAQIPAAVPGFFWMLDVSPDGSNLLVTSQESERPEYSLWIVRVLGGTSRRIGNGWSATFSPDGNSIAYLTFPGELWLVQSDGTGGRKLASIGLDIDSVRWSPDGKVIRFYRSGVLWEISANGLSLHEVLPGWQYRGPGMLWPLDA